MRGGMGLEGAGGGRRWRGKARTVARARAGASDPAELTGGTLQIGATRGIGGMARAKARTNPRPEHK